MGVSFLFINKMHRNKVAINSNLYSVKPSEDQYIMNKATRIIIPSYVSRFQCIGGDCEDSCCIGWDIDIDKLTFRKYFRTKNMEMKKDFVKHVYRNDNCDSEEVDYGRLRINDSKWCPFLDEKKLCRIYSNLGEDYLSNVCFSYPRVYNILDDEYELSLYMSCPEAIRIMLADMKPIEFIAEELTLDKHIIHSYIDTRDNKWNNSPIGRLKELRTLSIEIIQDRKISLTERLIKLGNKLENESMPYNSINEQDNHVIQLQFFTGAIESLQVFSEIDSPVFVEYSKKIMSGFKLEEDLPIADKARCYKEALEHIVDPFLKENSYLFEHYLVNFMFQSNFPFTENQDMFDGYVMLVIRYGFIKFYLSGIAAVEGEITREDVVLMIQIYTKTVEHHKTFIIDLLQDCKQNEFDNMHFLSSLLK